MYLLGQNKVMSLTMALIVAYAVMLLPIPALAEEPEALADVLCTVVGWFTGRVGAGIATLAILVIGIGALMGKVSWGMAIIVGIGVAIIFGAPTIVNALSDDAAGCA